MLSQYRVLARKYRPSTLSELVGQEALVKVLGNAIGTGRVAHAYLFTGIRGVGKTTTARILAKSLNCANGPTINPCGVCEHCMAIAEDRHMDVLEMDAASRTGVGDVREIIENAKYLPVSARNKIYIIDEVHMLSTNAFNALLKTLEEPPAHVKFIFATTEIRKIPITILSRCQRFDLKRIPSDMLANHLKNICQKESVNADNEAISLIVRASEGSARDSLSLLDQAIALGNGSVDKEVVATMLGVASRAQIFELIESIVEADAKKAMAQASEMLAGGSEGAVIIGDMLDVIASITKFRVDSSLSEDKSIPEFDRAKAAELAAKLDIAQLSILWQALSKAYTEVKVAVSQALSVQMIMVRLCHLASMPSLDNVLANISSDEESAQKKSPLDIILPSAPVIAPKVNLALEPILPPAPPVDVATKPMEFVLPEVDVSSFEAVVKTFKEKREPILYSVLMNDVSLAEFSAGKISLLSVNDVAADFHAKITSCLRNWTGKAWQVEVKAGQKGAVTLGSVEKEKKAKIEGEVREHPLVKKALESYPGSVIKNVKVTI